MASTGKAVLREWRWQRYTGSVIGIYFLALLIALLIYGPPTAAQWHGLFANVAFKLATLAVVLALCYHALIGVLHVWPDYVKHEGAHRALVVYSYAAVAAYALWAVYILLGLR